MARAAFYVDGFNLYHALKSTPKTAHCLWLDLRTLCSSLLTKNDTLVAVNYFTSLTPWNKSKMQRHQMFIDALKYSGVAVIPGRFSPVWKECGECGKMYQTYEEKETDVNIATAVLRDGLKDVYDTAYLMTGDSDQVPTIRALQELDNKKRVVAVFAVNRSSEDLKATAHSHVQLGWKHFQRNQFPLSMTTAAGHIIACPPSWIPPKP